mgnify:CR=1 FL=1
MNYHEDMYFKWLLRKIETRGIRIKSYEKLLEMLFETEFIWVVDMDVNRALDGVELRREFGLMRHGEYILGDSPCTLLEMMVALSSRIESGIMYDPEYGDRTGYWFWKMIENLGLKSAKNENFMPDYVEDLLENMMERTGKYIQKDLFFCSTFNFQKWHKMEIWQKMTAWINENYAF